MTELSEKAIKVPEPPTRVKLAGVKQGIYNPYLTNFKTIVNENTKGTLSTEHPRSTLPPGIVDIPLELFYQYNPPSQYQPGFDVLPLGSLKWRDDMTAESLSFLNNPQLSEAWKEFKRRLPLGTYRIVQIPSVRHFHYLNYHVRYLKPEVKSAWRSELPKD